MRVPVPGEVFEGRYRILQHVGAGAFGDVLLASDESVGRHVAIKCLTPGTGGYADRAVGRFEAEAKIVATLQHPNTVRLFDHGQTADGLLYMVFEYVEGVDLATWLARGRRFEPDEVLHIIGQVLEALMEAHHAGVLHRDIKPANIIAYEYGGDPLRVKLLDFGIAKLVDGDGRQPGLTGTGAVVGTPRYMSPEQVCHEPIGPPSDIYSLGLVGVELLGGTQLAESFKRDCLQAYLNPNRPPPGLPGDLASPLVRDLLRRMCDGQLQRRLPSAIAVRQTLDGFRQRTTPAAPATAPSKESDSGVGKLVAIALLVFAAVASVLFLVGRDDETPDVTLSRTEPTAVLYETAEPDLGGAPVDLGPSPPEGCDGRTIEPGFAEIEKFISVGKGSVVTYVYVPPGYDRLKRNQAMLVFGDIQMSGPAKSVPGVQVREGAEPVVSDIGLQQFANARNVVLVVVRDIPVEIGTVVKDPAGRRRTTALKRLAVAHDKLCLKDTVWLYGHGQGGADALSLTCELPGVTGVALSAYALGPGEHPCPDRPPVPTLMLGHVNRNEYVSKAPASGYLKGCRKKKSRFGREPNKSSMLRNQPRDEQVEAYTDLHECTDDPEQVWADDANSVCYEWDCGTRFRSCHFDISGFKGNEVGHTSAAFFQECYWRPTEVDYTEQLKAFFGEEPVTPTPPESDRAPSPQD